MIGVYMAIPEVNWQDWGASTIQPNMRVIMHFPSGNVIYTDDDIESISLSLSAFKSTATLFGPPSPSTGSIAIIDYNQTLNPTLNNELVEGIQIDLEIGLYGHYNEEQLGKNLVSSVESPQEVIYNSGTTWAYPFMTSVALESGATYLLSFDYVSEDGSEGSTEQLGTVEELFVRPSAWPDNKHFAVIYPDYLSISNLSVKTCENSYEPFGTFYAQEWSYDSEGSTATIDIIDGINDILQLDNRASGVLPYEGGNLLTAAIDYLELSTNTIITNITAQSVYNLLYFFYNDTQASTVNAMIEALGGMLFPLPDGTYAIGSYNGLYDTTVTLTDDDVESYSMEQTSSITMDSASVDAAIPTNVESSDIVTYSSIDVDPGDYLPLNASGVMSVDYIGAVTSELVTPQYDWDVVNLQYLGTIPITFDTFTVYGHAIEPTALSVYNVLGALPYSITENNYIQTKAHAQYLVDILDAFIDLKYRILKITLRGCPGFWLGARLNINSTMYNINAEYVIIGVDFTYNGAIATTLTLQRYVEVS